MYLPAQERKNEESKADNSKAIIARLAPTIEGGWWCVVVAVYYSTISAIATITGGYFERKHNSLVV
ncbi:hypothetical protein HanPSC8_Chr17g0755421 [Helianthus annuus]|nr:hypothetical protein HanPSC8_Chr17g0755421 [Helianthus annuus]